MSILENEVTSGRQARNGTRMFQCSKSGDLYGSYSSGYVRKKSQSSDRFYQLNKVVVKQHTRATHAGNFTHNTYSRVMITSEADRLALIKQHADKKQHTDK